MKIRIAEKNVVVDSSVITTTQCQSGTSYYRIEYKYNGEVVYGCNSSAMYGTPSAIEALTWEKEVYVEDDNTGGITLSNKPGKKFILVKKTNRDLLIEALNEIEI
jgi:hypothetical protein